MKRALLTAAIGFALIGTACTKESKTESQPAGQEVADLEAAQKKTQEEQAKQIEKLSKSAWMWLEAEYNKDSGNPRVPFWGSKGAAPISAFVLLGGLKTGMIDVNDTKLKETLAELLTAQAAEGFWYLGRPGDRAVYCTSAVVKLLSYVRDNTKDGYAARDKVIQAAKRGMDYLKKAQVGAPDSPLQVDDKNVHYGGWAYSAEELGPDKVKIDDKTGKPKPSANLSTSIFALDAAVAFGLDPKDKLFERAQVFLNRHHNAGEVEKGIAIKTLEGETVADPDPKDPNYGGARYSPETSKAGKVKLEDDRVILKSYGSMTYALLRAYLHTGLSKDSTRVQLAYKWIAKNFTVTKNPGFPSEGTLDQQGLYYQHMQMARTLSLFGDTIADKESGFSQNWKTALLDELEKKQTKDGFWMNPEDRWMEKMPILATSYVLNALGDMK